MKLVRPLLWLLWLWGCNRADGDLPRAYRSLEVPAERLADAAARARGRSLFLRHCVLCHGERADGRGVRQASLSTHPPNFSDPSWRAGMSPRRAFATIREGKQGTPMPAWKWLPETETWDLVAYVLSVNETVVD
jgi:mono/diheme cytochrome c family protein